MAGRCRKVVDAGPTGGECDGSVGGSAQEGPGPGAAWEDVTRGEMVPQGGAGRKSRGAVAS